MLGGHASVVSYARGNSIVCVRNCRSESHVRFGRGNGELYESLRGNKVDGLPRVAIQVWDTARRCRKFIGKNSGERKVEHMSGNREFV